MMLEGVKGEEACIFLISNGVLVFEALVPRSLLWKSQFSRHPSTTRQT